MRGYTNQFVSSIRFRVWVLFIAFTTAILIFLYICQVLMLPTFYEAMKKQETVTTMAKIKADWDSDSLNTTVDRLANDQQMSIRYYKINKDFPQYSYSYTKDRSGSRVAVLEQVEFRDEFINELVSTPDGIKIINQSVDGKDAMVLISYVGEPDNIRGYILVFNYLEPLGTTTQIIQNSFYLNAFVILVVAFGLSAFVVAGIANPIIKISRSAKKLSTGEFNMVTKKSDYTEIKELTENLNDASAEIARTETLRKDLLANVSHDLKTPLTMIKAYAEMIRDLSGNNPEKREKHLQVIIDETDRLNLLVKDILDLSKLQSGVSENSRTCFCLSEELEEVISRFSYLREQSGYDIKCEIQPDIYIDADKTKIEQVIYNLTGNAVNYAGEQKRVLVRLFLLNAKTARFEVIDNGEGIPEEQIKYIWDRYYKVNKSENHHREVTGTGLGLSIVKGVLEAHGYKYGAQSILGQGSTFWFECPISSPKGILKD